MHLTRLTLMMINPENRARNRSVTPIDLGPHSCFLNFIMLNNLIVGLLDNLQTVVMLLVLSYEAYTYFLNLVHLQSDIIVSFFFMALWNLIQFQSHVQILIVGRKWTCLTQLNLAHILAGDKSCNHWEMWIPHILCICAAEILHITKYD